MLMVVFGAGASYDSAPSFKGSLALQVPSRPPLALELFENREAFARVASTYKRMLPIVPLLRETVGRSVVEVEEVLAKLQEEARAYPEGQRQLVAVRYYLRDILWDCTHDWTIATGGVTNYRSLLDQIARQRHKRAESLALVTFNYDTLLEGALADQGFRTENISDYVHQASHKLFKLHGSIDWARCLHSPSATTLNKFDIIDRAPKLQMTDQFVLNNHRQDVVDNLLAFPAIAIPVQSKDHFECPQEHVHVLEKLIPDVSQILFIGWRAREDTFLQLLRHGLNALKGIMVVDRNKDSAQEVAARIQDGAGPFGLKARVFLANGGFSTFVETREGDEFFRL